MSNVPTAVRAHQAEGLLEIQWADDAAHQFPYRLLRAECPCAECVDEMTGIRRLDVKRISDQIRPMHLAFSGNYALKIHWNDGHNTGLYTWDHLRRLASHPQVTPRTQNSPEIP